MSDKAKLWTCAANSGVVRKFQWSFDIGSLNIYIGILLIVIILAIAQHGAFMHDHQALLECCRALELQEIQLTTEHDTIRSMFEHLIPYLEDENGNPVPKKTVTAIRKLLHGGWSEHLNQQLAPQSWGRLLLGAS
ncbi:hypothetical protein P692DRAFT_20819333 [Suillus brevipes Sb2]|nr:hypothetical protein P692DRAFT_20819333 [Suillus brevipes Sb2]